MKPDVIIIGGGIIGTACAYFLVDKGAKVMVLERSHLATNPELIFTNRYRAEIEEQEIPFEPKALLEEAQRGGFFSYAAGVAYQILTNYQVRGLVVDNYKTDLPIKKGLSSSAAISVLVARAFNRAYDLKLTTRGEMELAYQGEITTPSRCGRMDQGCAYGNRPVRMTFDGDRLDVEEVNVPRTLNYVIVDLKGQGVEVRAFVEVVDPRNRG